MPDEVLQFIKARPLMDQAVGHDSGKPLYYLRDAIFQKIVVDFVGNYRIFYLGTSELFLDTYSSLSYINLHIYIAIFSDWFVLKISKVLSMMISFLSDRGEVYKIVDFDSNGERKSKLLAVYSPFSKLSNEALPIWEMKLHVSSMVAFYDSSMKVHGVRSIFNGGVSSTTPLSCSLYA